MRALESRTPSGAFSSRRLAGIGRLPALAIPGYRRVFRPDYLVVMTKIVAAPPVLGLSPVAMVFLRSNALLRHVRIGEEARFLGLHPGRGHLTRHNHHVRESSGFAMLAARGRIGPTTGRMPGSPADASVWPTSVQEDAAMPDRTIGNPLSWSAQRLAGMGRGLGHAIDGIGGHQAARPQINRIDLADLGAALGKGARDFAALRSDVIFLVVLYPVIGFILGVWVLNAGQVHLLFPLVAGFPLIGPVAAVGLYEMSRRREAGLPANWGAALSALSGQVLGPVLMLGLLLLVIFVLWLGAAHAIWAATLGPQTYDSLPALLRDSLTTGPGREMLVLGTAVGFVFAALVLCIGMVSFPMLIDRPVGVPLALATSWAVAKANPGATAAWGLIVAGSLMLGMIPLFAGLIVVLPILGHATWHLYRRAVTFRDPAAG